LPATEIVNFPGPGRRLALRLSWSASVLAPRCHPGQGESEVLGPGHKERGLKNVELRQPGIFEYPLVLLRCALEGGPKRANSSWPKGRGLVLLGGHKVEVKAAASSGWVSKRPSPSTTQLRLRVRPRGPLKGPRGPFKGPRGPFKGPRGPFKGVWSLDGRDRPARLSAWPNTMHYVSSFPDRGSNRRFSEVWVAPGTPKADQKTRARSAPTFLLGIQGSSGRPHHEKSATMWRQSDKEEKRRTETRMSFPKLGT